MSFVRRSKKALGGALGAGISAFVATLMTEWGMSTNTEVEYIAQELSFIASNWLLTLGGAAIGGVVTWFSPKNED